MTAFIADNAALELKLAWRRSLIILAGRSGRQRNCEGEARTDFDFDFSDFSFGASRWISQSLRNTGNQSNRMTATRTDECASEQRCLAVENSFGCASRSLRSLSAWKPVMGDTVSCTINMQAC